MKKTNKKQKINRAVNAVINEYRKGSSQSDPFGMYTGITTVDPLISQSNTNGSQNVSALKAEEEQPTQDADDL